VESVEGRPRQVAEPPAAEAAAADDADLVAKIRAAMERRDAEAHGHRSRRLTFAVFAAVLGPLAVMLLAVQRIAYDADVDRPIAIVLISGELVLLALALALGFMQIGRSHRRWISERLRAELLRREQYLLQMRVGPYLMTPSPTEHDVDQRLLLLDSEETDPEDCLELEDPVRGTWWDSLEDNRSSPGATSLPCVPDCVEQYRKDRVESLRNYFRSRSESHGAEARLWENAAKTVLVLALVVAAVHLGMLVSDAHVSEAAHNALILLAIGLPAVGGALVGLLSISGSNRLHRAYEYNAKELQKIEARLLDLVHEMESKARPVEQLAYEAKRLVLQTEELISDDARQWWLIMSPEAPKAGP